MYISRKMRRKRITKSTIRGDKWGLGADAETMYAAPRVSLYMYKVCSEFSRYRSFFAEEENSAYYFSDNRQSTDV